MRAVVQRVTRARVSVEEKVSGEIAAGLVVLLAVGANDSAEVAAPFAEKIVNLRIFNDEQGKMNRSLLDTRWRDAGNFAIHALWRRARRAAAEFYSGRACGSGQGNLRSVCEGGGVAGRAGGDWSFSGAHGCRVGERRTGDDFAGF